MSLSTGGVSQLSGGAGRTIHLRWPDLNFFTLTANGQNRLGVQGTANVMTTVVQGAPPATTQFQYKGIRCARVFSAAGGAGTAHQFAAVLNFAQNATSYPLNQDDSSVTEVRFLLAFDRPAGDLGDSLDLGVGIGPGNNNQNTFNPAVGAVYRAGVQFGPGGPGKLRFRSRPGQTIVGPPPYNTGLGFDTGNTVPTFAFDEREWHWYAIRVVGGSNAGVGICKALLDGVEFSRFNIDFPTNIFPDPSAGVGGQIGHHAGVTNATNGTFDAMYLARASLILAPTEADVT